MTRGVVETDYLVNNTGLNVPALIGEYTESDFRRMVELNMVSTAMLTQAAVPHLAAGDGSAILNISTGGSRKATLYPALACDPCALRNYTSGTAEAIFRPELFDFWEKLLESRDRPAARFRVLAPLISRSRSLRGAIISQRGSGTSICPAHEPVVAKLCLTATSMPLPIGSIAASMSGMARTAKR